MLSRFAKPPLRVLKRVATGAGELVWARAFGLVGQGRPASVAGWHSPGGQRVLVLAPHPDDEAVGCAGVLALHGAAGDSVRVLWVSDGRRSRAMGLGPAEMARRRHAEALACAAVVGFAGEWLGLPEGEWEGATLRSALGARLAAWLPDLIYVPSRADFHPEHLAVAYAFALALADWARRPTLRIYPVQVPLTTVLANMVADVSSVVPTIAAALGAYKSQSVSVACAIRMRRYAARRFGRGTLAEEFWELSPAQYLALHCDNLPGTGGFRSLRPAPWLDPLAYLVGRESRRELLELAERGRD